MGEDPFVSRHCLYDTAQLLPVFERMAAAAADLLTAADSPLLVGVLRRGEPLAQLLAQRLAIKRGAPLPVLGLKLKRYADDLTVLHPETELVASAEIAAFDFGGRTVLLVDDVLYQGHSLLRAVAYLAGRGCETIRTAVLVDRHIASMPIRADIVGLTLEVAADDVIECHVPPYEPTLQIDLCRRGSSQSQDAMPQSNR